MTDAPANTPADPPKDPAATVTPTPTDDTPVDFGNDTEKWKHFSRENESKAKAKIREAEQARAEAAALKEELDALKAAGMTDAEKAIKDAEASGRTKALSEVGEKLAAAALLAAGAKDGLDLSEEVGDLKLAKFVKEDGEVDTEAVANYVERQKGRGKPRGKSAAQLGAGPQSDPGKKPQLGDADLKRMSAEQIVAAQNAGQFDELLGRS